MKRESLAVPDRYLCFSLNAERYAIPLLSVKEVIGLCDITPIPCSADYFKGVLNLRGQIISVIDLKKKLKIGEEAGSEPSIVIVDFESLQLGFVVDSVDKVCAWDAGKTTPPPDTPFAIEHRFIAGVAQEKDALTLLLDLENVLSISDFAAARSQSETAA